MRQTGTLASAAGERRAHNAWRQHRRQYFYELTPQIAVSIATTVELE
jgi:hypothetical protein